MKNLHLEDISEEILIKIINYCDGNSITKMASVSKKWQRLTGDNLVWKKRIFDQLTEFPKLVRRDCYQSYYQRIYNRIYKNFLSTLQNNQNNSSMTLNDFLLEACHLGAEKWVKFLIELGCDVNYHNKRYEWNFNYGCYKPVEKKTCTLIEAIQADNPVLFNYLLQQPVDLNFKASNDEIDKHSVIHFNNEAILKRGTIFHAALNSSTPDVHLKAVAALNQSITVVPALHLAVAYGDFVQMKILIEQGFNINEKDFTGCTPVWWAVMKDCPESLKILLEAGAQIKEVCTSNKRSALRVAIEAGKKRSISTLFNYAHTLDINEYWYYFARSVNEDPVTPLEGAIKYNLSQCVEYLLSRNVVDRDAGLLLAVQKERADIVYLLTKAKANVNAVIKGSTPLITAVRKANLPITRNLLENGADVNLTVSFELNVFQEFIKYLKALISEVNKIQELILFARERGIFPPLLQNLKRNRSYEFFKESYDPDHVQNLRTSTVCGILKLLFRHKLDKKLVNGSSLSMLIESMNTNTDVVSVNINKLILKIIAIFIENQVDVNVKVNSRTARYSYLLHIAVDQGNFEFVTLLVEKGKARIDAVNSNGDTPLLIAAMNGHDKIAEYLVHKGANTDHRNNFKETAMTLAEKNGHSNLMTVLYNAAFPALGFKE